MSTRQACHPEPRRRRGTSQMQIEPAQYKSRVAQRKRMMSRANVRMRARTCAIRDDAHFTPSLVAQRFYWIEPRSAIGREEGKDAANEKRPDANDCYIARDHFRGDFRKLVNLPGKDFYMSRPCEPLAELISVTNEHHAQTETG